MQSYDEYYEQTSVPDAGRSGGYWLMRIVKWAFLVLAAVYAFMLLTIQVGNVIGLVQCIGMIVIGLGTFFLLLWKTRRMRAEYEYIYASGDLEVSRIVANKRRTQMLLADVGVFEHFGVIADSNEFEKLRNAPETKTVMASAGGRPTHFAYFKRGSARTLLCFSPDEKMAELIEKYNRRARQIQGIR